MADTRRHRSVTRWTRFWSGCAIERHQLPLTVVGLVCIGFGIVVAVRVPDSGPAWAMAVAGCLAAGVLLLVRVALARLRSGGGTAT